MAISFELSPKEYVLMLSKVPAESSAYTKLKNATHSERIHDTAQVPNYVVTCNNIGEAEQFLAIAKKHCPEAMATIEQAIRSFLA